jgi:hypothetical protein
MYNTNNRLEVLTVCCMVWSKGLMLIVKVYDQG